MTTTTLGNSGITVPTLGIGTWAWGDKLFWNYGKDYGREEVRAAFDAAVAAGITFFDTAEVYGLGESESLLGRFIQQTESPIQIATKYAPLPWRFSGDAVSQAITASLQRLQLSQITLYQVHWPFTFFLSQETLSDTLANEVEKGRIQAIGVSNYSTAQMQETYEILAKRGIPLAVNQVQYSLLYRKIETEGILSTARELGVTILAYSPLAQGLLTGKYTPEKATNLNGARRLDPRFSSQGLQKIAPVLDLLKNFGEKYQKTPAQVALNWLIAQGNVIPIPGAKNASHAQENSEALGWSLNEEEIEQLENISRPWL
jgi:aryl-alcohol dehydrogenase-like predicted oxidoreductase